MYRCSGVGYNINAAKKFGCYELTNKTKYRLIMEDLNKYSHIELSKGELKRIDGGRSLLPVPITFWGVIEVIDAWNAFRKGVEEGCKCATEE